MKFENVTKAKGSRNVLNRISLCGKSLMVEGLPSSKLCLANVRLMSATLQKVSHYQTESIVCFGLFIDKNRVIFSNETTNCWTYMILPLKLQNWYTHSDVTVHHMAFVMHIV